MKNAKPRILIGQDNCDLIVAREVIEGPKNAPTLTRTKLGWIVHGNVKTFRSRVDEDFLLHVYNNEKDELLHQLVKDCFRTDAFGVMAQHEKPQSKDDERAQRLLEATTKRVGDRWETGLLWKQDNVNLLNYNSKAVALHRLKSIEQKMDRDAQFSEKYCAKIEEYLSKNYARIVPEDEKKRGSEKTWYLPHFGVVNPNKPGKFRFVFDAAAKTNGKCINDFLLQGPDLLNSLPGVLFRFRQREVAFSADIKEMFHQVRIRKEDSMAQRFLWRGQDRNREPDVLEMSVMIFGSVSSPFQAQEIKNKNAREFEKEYPNAARAIIYRHYMDDYLDSAHTEEESKRLIAEVIEIHRSAGFEICNWISSSKEVLRSIPKHLRSATKQDLNLETNDLSIERVLGLHWNANEDTFIFICKFHKVEEIIVNGSRAPTKREVLRTVMSIFDPLGCLTPFTVKAKILLQDIWRSEIHWDDELQSSCLDKWKKWVSELQNINKIKVPRCYSENMIDAKSIQLHIFCDASEKAFAAVAYFRIAIGREVHTMFVAAKSRVSPLRPMSIPRLELQAAVMASRLAKTIIDEHEIEINRILFWTDSRTVICWLHSDARKHKPFVAHRIGEIEELTDINNWKWIPTAENVADEATRDGKIYDLGINSRWINGPMFLKLEETEWTQMWRENSDKITDDILELKKEYVCMISTLEYPLPDVHRFSSWMRLIRTTAWTLRFVNNCLSKINLRDGQTNRLTPRECLAAEKWWWRKAQLDSFPIEVSCFRRKQSIPTSSRLKTLSVVMDEDDVLRMKGRLGAAPGLSESTKQPVILDPKHRYTRLLVHHYHKEAGHHGQEYVMNELRQKYWILNIRHAVRSSWSSCQLCKIKRSKPNIPEMGPLPAVRLTGFVRPFTYTGMDYFGPIVVTIGRRREKRYGVLFTCLSIRAVHVELASSLSTDSAVMAVRRFIGRRGTPSKIYSDNGTNLRGCDKELKKALKEIDQQEMLDNLTPRGIEWHFIPPSAPHMGGSWERLVRSIKTALKATLNEREPRDEVLRTLLIEAEGIVNSRPLTHVSSDPDDEESLTPNHFLIGTSSIAAAPGVFTENEFCLRKRWRIAQRLADNFWKRWVREYLPTLTRRCKWTNRENADPAKVGDLVVIADGDLPRNSWPRGIITEIYPGADGLVRVVDVKTKSGTFRRPVAKICILDVQQSTVDDEQVGL